VTSLNVAPAPRLQLAGSGLVLKPPPLCNQHSRRPLKQANERLWRTPTAKEIVMLKTKLLGAVAVAGFIAVQCTSALAACPKQGCPRGYACAGNPIWSTCVPVEIKPKPKKKKSVDSAPMSVRTN
jgi:hypothetical protein